MFLGVSNSPNFAVNPQILRSFKRVTVILIFSLFCNIIFKENKYFKLRLQSRRSTVLHDPYKSNERSRYVELIIVNDNKEVSSYS